MKAVSEPIRRLFARSAQSKGEVAPPGLHGDMDAPRPGDVCNRRAVLIGGWVLDDDGPIETVDVVVDGVRVDTVAVEHERADIARHFTNHDHALVSGWTTRVDLSAWLDDEVEVVAWAIRADGSRARIARASCRLIDVDARDETTIRGGKWLVPDLLHDGYQRLYGVARAPGGISTVDVRLDEVEVGRARVALPGAYLSDAGDKVIDAIEAVGAFELVLPLVATDGAPRTLAATVTGMDGVAFDLEPVDLEIEPSGDVDWSTNARMAMLRARSEIRANDLSEVASLAGTEPIRALVFTHDLGLGGGQLYLQELLVRLAARGIWAAVVSPKDGVLRESLEKLGFPVHITGGIPVSDPDQYEGRIAELVSWAAPLRCNVVLANTMLAFAGVDAATRLDLPIVWAIHESFDLEQFWVEAYAAGSAHQYVKQRAKVALGATSAAVFEAHATHAQYEPYLMEGAGRVVPYGVSMTELDEYLATTSREDARAARGIIDDSRVVLCMGTVEPRKAQLMLAHAFAGVEPDRETILVLVGGRPSTYMEAIESFVEHSGLEDRVRIEPIVEDTYGWYRAADLLVCASDVESLPRSILECMAFGVPVLSTAVFGIPELIDDGVTGFLCAPRDAIALRTRLDDVLGMSDAELRAVGEAGSDLVRRRHDPRIYVEKYHELLVSMTDRA